jgi:hypothetical protein
LAKALLANQHVTEGKPAGAGIHLSDRIVCLPPRICLRTIVVADVFLAVWRSAHRSLRAAGLAAFAWCLKHSFLPAHASNPLHFAIAAIIPRVLET